MDFLQSIYQSIVGENPSAALLVILNLILIESLLSVDNAAVLATMVMDLPKAERGRALRYGIIGAYVFRGLALIFASYLIKIWWLKPLGGLYLLYLAYDFFKTKQTPDPSDDTIERNESWLYRSTVGWLGSFWATVAAVEIMDMAFSIDNVLAAVAYTDKIALIWIGVFIGILAMRFVAQAFVDLMEKYPFLAHAAFLVIALLGLKLCLSTFSHFYPEMSFSKILESHEMDTYFSVLTVIVFGLPILTSILFNFPKKAENISVEE